jgi:hypothetical protein
MGGEFLTWENLIIWVVNSVVLYFTINFRLYMIFHHPARKLRKHDKFRALNGSRRMNDQGSGGFHGRQLTACRVDCEST